jgi:diguanylate cyclase (GGDEF)-like protein/PAS domain S-box-containing protein
MTHTNKHEASKEKLIAELSEKDRRISELERALNRYGAELKERSNQLEQVLAFINAVPDFICFKDKEGKWLFINDAGLDVFKLKGVDFRGKTEHEIAEYAELSHKEALFSCLQIDEDAIGSNEIIQKDEAILLFDGSKKIYDFIRTPLFNQDGSRKGLAIFARDVTEQRTMEDEIRQKNEQLTTMAITDALTGIFNRRYLIVRFEEEFKKSKRLNSPFGCILIDIDKFKHVNDNYGHLIGDEVIKKACLIVKESVRIYDIVGRFGGEEFLIILPDTKKDDALHLAERLRSKVKEGLWVDIDGSDAINITISLGVTCFNEGDASIDDMFKRADDALYKAKKGGRDRVEWGDY